MCGLGVIRDLPMTLYRLKLKLTKRHLVDIDAGGLHQLL
ncbi:unnamed protein product [Brassica oleracea var. botrytis]|uniref:Uncharacterized protein n=1 Tax=Brassica oleracea TaxID=3712 RepID=A0A3P6ERU6_BRAOL|nr:unnamed protein product [Brassica oleracea]